MKQLKEGDAFIFIRDDGQSCFKCAFKHVQNCSIIPFCFGGYFVFRSAKEENKCTAKIKQIFRRIKNK